MFLQANLGGVGVLQGLPSLGLGAYWDTTPASSESSPYDIGPTVTRDYCARLACGAVTQSEAGPEKSRACGIQFPMQAQAWCSPACEPYLDELHGRYQFGCGPVIAEPPPQEMGTPMPVMVPTPPPLDITTLPAVIRPTLTTLDPATCPACNESCFIQIGDCCLTDLQVLALAGLVVLAVVT